MKFLVVSSTSSLTIALFVAVFMLAGTLGQYQYVSDVPTLLKVNIGRWYDAVLYSPGVAETGRYRQNERIWWNISAHQIQATTLLVYPVYIDLEYCCDLEECCDHVTISGPNSEPVKYTGQDMTMRDNYTRAALAELPTIHCNSGTVMVKYRTDESTQFSGFGFRFVPLFNNRAIPEGYEIYAPVFLTLQQFEMQSYVPEVTVKSPNRWTRLVFIVVYMNYSSLDVEQNTPCIYQREKLQVYDRYCNMDNCHAGILCRQPQTFSRIKLITWWGDISIRSFCEKPPNTTCAVINYMQLNDFTDRPRDYGCPLAPLDAEISEFFVLEHSWNASTPKDLLDKTWWFENTNAGPETLIQTVGNQLSRGPDCLLERIEIYNGACAEERELITTFCGGVFDTIKLTAFKRFAIRFVGNPREDQKENLRFSLWIFANKYYGVPTPKPYLPDSVTDTPFESLLDILKSQISSEPNAWEDYKGVWITLIVVAVVVVIVSAGIKRRFRRKLKKKIRKQMWPPPLYTGWKGTGVPPAAVYNPPTSQDKDEKAKKQGK